MTGKWVGVQNNRDTLFPFAFSLAGVTQGARNAETECVSVGTTAASSCLKREKNPSSHVTVGAE